MTFEHLTALIKMYSLRLVKIWSVKLAGVAVAVRCETHENQPYAVCGQRRP